MNKIQYVMNNKSKFKDIFDTDNYDGLSENDIIEDYCPFEFELECKYDCKGLHAIGVLCRECWED